MKTKQPKKPGKPEKPKLQDISQGHPERRRLDPAMMARVQGMEKDLRLLAEKHGLKIGILFAVDQTGAHTLTFGQPAGLVKRLQAYVLEAIQRMTLDAIVVRGLRRVVDRASKEN